MNITDASITSSKNTDTMLDGTQFYAETVLAATAYYPFYNSANMAQLKKAVDDLNAGKGTMHELIEVDDE